MSSSEDRQRDAGLREPAAERSLKPPEQPAKHSPASPVSGGFTPPDLPEPLRSPAEQQLIDTLLSECRWPEQVWQHSAALSSLRVLAAAQTASPEAVAMSALTAVSVGCGARLKLDTGQREGSVGLYTVLVGTSGASKSTALDVGAGEPDLSELADSGQHPQRITHALQHPRLSEAESEAETEWLAAAQRIDPDVLATLRSSHGAELTDAVQLRLQPTSGEGMLDAFTGSYQRAAAQTAAAAARRAPPEDVETSARRVATAAWRHLKGADRVVTRSQLRRIGLSKPDIDDAVSFGSLIEPERRYEYRLSADAAAEAAAAAAAEAARAASAAADAEARAEARAEAGAEAEPGLTVGAAPAPARARTPAKAAAVSRALLAYDEAAFAQHVASRDGSTLNDLTRTAWSGGALRTDNAVASDGASRSRHLPAGLYRIGVIACATGNAAAAFASATESGDAQRYVFVPNNYEHDSSSSDLPDNDFSPVRYPHFAQRTVITCEPEVQRIVQQHRKAAAAGRVPDAEAHRAWSTARVAACLMLLAADSHSPPERLTVTLHDWDAADAIMQASFKAQAACRDYAAARDVDDARHVAETLHGAKQSAVTDDSPSMIERAAETILRRGRIEAGSSGGVFAHRTASRAVSSADRDRYSRITSGGKLVDDALTHLIDNGLIVETEGPRGGRRFRCTTQAASDTDSDDGSDPAADGSDLAACPRPQEPSGETKAFRQRVLSEAGQ